jgi:hypothetical protein
VGARHTAGVHPEVVRPGERERCLGVLASGSADQDLIITAPDA